MTFILPTRPDKTPKGSLSAADSPGQVWAAGGESSPQCFGFLPVRRPAKDRNCRCISRKESIINV